MEKQQIKRFKKFPELPGIDNEFDLIIKQIRDLVGLSEISFGELYIHNTSTVVVSIAAGGTFYQVTGFKVGENDKVNVNTNYISPKIAGTYKISVFLCVNFSVIDSDLEFAVYKNGTAVDRIDAVATSINIGDRVILSGQGFLALKASDRLDIRVTSDKIGDLEIFDANFHIIGVK